MSIYFKSVISVGKLFFKLYLSNSTSKAVIVQRRSLLVIKKFIDPQLQRKSPYIVFFFLSFR